MISSVAGSFTRFSGSVETTGDDFTSAKVEFTAEIDSISTNNEQRDAHLKNGDFFDSPAFPQLYFESSKLVRVDEETYSLQGELTIRDKTKPVTFEVEYGGTTIDPWGGTRAGFSLKGKIKRSDFGISFGMVSETGGILLADDVKLSAEVQFVKEVIAVSELV